MAVHKELQDPNDDQQINTLIKGLEAKRYDLIRQISQQTIIDRRIDEFGKDLTKIQHFTKTKIEDVDSFLSRKHKFRNDSSVCDEKDDIGADKEVDRDLNLVYSKRSILSKAMNECPTCHARVLTPLWREHKMACSVMANKSKSIDAASIEAAYPPQQQGSIQSNSIKTCPIIAPYNPVRPNPPRNLRVKAVDFSSMTIEWDQSIFDGGDPIVDYEIIYYFKPEQLPAENKIRKRKYSELCSQWCLKHPIPKNSFKIEELVAASTYCDIKLRCRNKVGWSKFCEKIENVTIAEPVEPLEPQNFSVKDVTSTSIHLQWSPPFHCGGGVLDGYQLTYQEPIDDVKQEAGQQLKKFHLKKVVVPLSSDRTFCILEDLKGDTLYRDFQLTAISNFGLKSEIIQCPDVRTKVSSQLYSIKKEIDWVQSSADEYFDTDFLQSGVVQREHRSTYLLKLNKELLKLQSDKSDRVENDNLISTGINDVDGSVSSVDLPEIPDRREQNFYFRINALQSEIEECKTSMEENTAARALVASKLPHTQENLQIFSTELKRISEVTDNYVNSTVLHAAEQKFLTVELRLALKRKLDEETSLIESWKSEVTTKEREYFKLSAILDDTKGRLDERKAALLIFQKQRTTSFHLRSRTSQKPKDILKSSFNKWVLKVMECRKLRNIEPLRCRLITRQLFLIWRNNTKHHSRVMKLKKEHSVIRSKGGILLLEAEAEGIDVYEDIKGFMKELHHSSISKFKGNNNDEKDFQRDDNLFSLVRGDFHFNLAQYDTALKHYRDALRVLSTAAAARPDEAQIRCTLMDKIGKTFVYMNSWNEAILNYYDLLSLAKATKNIRFELVANIGLGDCYLFTGDTMEAKKHYIRCLSHNVSKMHSDLKAVASRGLEACQNPNICHLPPKLPDDESGTFAIELLEQIRKEREKADLILAQVGNTSTKVGYTIELERVSCKCVNAKRSCINIKKDIETKEQELLNVKKDLKHLPKLISNIKNELHGSSGNQEESGSRRTSSLVHDNNQEFEVNELLHRLQIRLDESMVQLTKARSTDELLTVEIRNLQDELVAFQEDIKLEKGILSQKNLKRRSIRLMEFDSLFISNDCDKNECSEKMLVAITIDKDLYIYDAMSGEALQVFEGDTVYNATNQSTGHTATITSLYFEGNFVFTGSLDKSVRSWNLDSNKLYYVAKGHESTITSICTTISDVYSGSADRTIIRWDKKTGAQLHRLIGHSRGILSLCRGHLGIVSGDGDGDIFVWDENLSISHRLELIPHHRVTVIKSGKLEVVSGDNGGFVTMFWLETGELLKQCKAHDTSVTSIEFDATKIISCGMDGCVKVMDSTSFEIIHTIRCQDDPGIPPDTILLPIPGLSLTFDSDKIITLTKDGKIRYWMWESRSNPQRQGEEYHRVATGETVASIAKLYGLSIVNLVKWNVNHNMKNIQVGQKLLVGKPEPEDTGASSTTSTAVGSEKREPHRLRSRQTPTKNSTASILLKNGAHSSSAAVEPTSLASRLFRGNNI